MKQHFAIFLLSVFATALSAQTELRYDLATDSLHWFKNGKRLARAPRLREGQEVILRFTELNNYLHELRVETEALPDAEASGTTGGLAIFAQMAGGLMPGVSDLLRPGGGLLPGGAAPGGLESTARPDTAAAGRSGLSLLNIPLLRINDRSVTLKNLFKGSRGADELIAQNTEAVQDVAESIETFRATYAEMKQLERSARAARLAADQLENLRHAPGIRPSTIRRMTAEFYRHVFPGELPGAEPSVEDLLDWQEQPARFAAALQNLRAGRSGFDRRLARLDGLNAQIQQLDPGSEPAFDTWTKDLRSAQKQALEAAAQWDRVLAEGGNMLKSDFLPAPEEIAALQLRMAETLQNPFAQSVQVRLEEGTTLVTVHLFGKKKSPGVFSGPDTSVQKTPAKTVRLRLQTSGGLRIRAGAGVQFGSFFESPQVYGVREGRIAGSEGDLFQPAITSMLHFYPAARRGLTLGGSFGVGFPVQGEGKGLRFFLGPSLLLGKGGRLAFSTGAMLGQTPRLARGFKTGDLFDPSNGDIPMDNRFRPGWFAGLSFSVYP